MTEDQSVPKYLSQSDVARQAGVSRSSVTDAVAAGVLKRDVTVGRGAGFKASNPTVAEYVNRVRRK